MTVYRKGMAERFSVQSLSDHVRILSSDEFEGRLPGSLGETKTITYLGEQFEKIGLQPGGDAGCWTQSVPLRKSEPTDVQCYCVVAGDTCLDLIHRSNAILSCLPADFEVQIDEAPIVFLGHGIYAPELDWDDFKGIDLEGHIALILVNDPDFSSSTPGRFGGKAMTSYGRWEYKLEEARRRGAAGALIIHEDAPAGYGWDIVVNSLGGALYDLESTDSANAGALLRGWLRGDTASRLLRAAGLSLEELKARAIHADFKPVLLQKAHLTFRAKFRVTAVVSHNVIAKIVGCERPQECVIYGAHWDHLGVAPYGDVADAVYHGAVDNATAIAAILELSRAFSTARKPARSVYFVAFTAEEKGLLGSKYYVTHPPADIELTAAVFTMEFLGATGPARDISTWGNVRNGLWDALSKAAAQRGRFLTADRYLEAGYFFRSDHFPFAQRGVPALTVTSGQDLYEGGEVAGRKAYSDYIAHRYHKPADCWSPNLDLRGLALDLAILYDAGLAIATSTSWPQWDEETQYKGARAKSDERRTASSD